MTDTLAYHESLELHELVAFQSNALIKLKSTVGKITDSDLKNLYIVSIKALENNIRELIRFFPKAPVREDEERPDIHTGFYAGDLLGLAKTAVRNYSIAITETATPILRQVLVKQINAAIEWHAQIYRYMYKNGLYPSYDLKKLITNDVNNAQKALNMRYE